MKRNAKRYLVALVVAGVTAFVPSTAAQAIAGGQLAGDQYGAVGEVVFQPRDGSPVFDLCSGFLISPTVFVTAGHCAIEALGNQAAIGGEIGGNFDPTFDPAHATFRRAASVVVDPDFLTNLGYQNPDVAVLVLEDPVTGVAPIKLAAVGTADRLVNGTQLTTVGYGWTQECGTDLGHCQVRYDPARRFVTETLNSTSQWFITVTQNPNAQGEGGVCRGDSGGPHLLPGTMTAVALTTSILSKWCWSTSRDIRLDTPLALQFLRPYMPPG